MSVRRAAALLVCLVVLACARNARAQASGPAGPGRLEISVGGLWIGHQALGEMVANETTGAGSAFRIFTASSDLAAGAGFEGRVAVRVLRSLEAEMNASYEKPQLKITIGNDIENAPPVTAIETIQQLTVGAGLVWYVPVGVGTRKLAPFVAAGGGYLRQVHEAGTLLETGRFYQVGGGVKYLLFERARGHVKALGARIDVRAISRARGVAFDDRGHASPAAGVSAFVRF